MLAFLIILGVGIWFAVASCSGGDDTERMLLQFMGEPPIGESAPPADSDDCLTVEALNYAEAWQAGVYEVSDLSYALAAAFEDIEDIDAADPEAMRVWALRTDAAATSLHVGAQETAALEAPPVFAEVDAETEQMANAIFAGAEAYGEAVYTLDEAGLKLGTDKMTEAVNYMARAGFALNAACDLGLEDLPTPFPEPP